MRIAIFALALCAAAALPAGESESVLPEGAEANCPVFRGVTNGATNFGNLPTDWKYSEDEKVNVRWRKELDTLGWTSPVIWGDKVLATGANPERRVVYCHRLDNGEQLWKVEVPLPEDGNVTEEYAIDAQDPDRWDHILYAAGAPATDGEKVYAIFSHGQLVALNLADGSVSWNVGLGSIAYNTWGLTNAPLLYKDMLIVVVEGDESYIAAYNRGTGEQVWKTAREECTWSSPILIRTEEGLHQVVMLQDPNVKAWNPDTGAELWKHEVVVNPPNDDGYVGPTVIYGGGKVIATVGGNGIYAIDPANGQRIWANEDLFAYPDGVSPVTDGTFIYHYFEYDLSVLRVSDGMLVTEEPYEAEDSSSYASPILDSGNLYLFGGYSTEVLRAKAGDPAQGFERVGTGELSFEGRDSSPAVVSGAIVFRTDNLLYCLGNPE